MDKSPEVLFNFRHGVITNAIAMGARQVAIGLNAPAFPAKLNQQCLVAVFIDDGSHNVLRPESLRPCEAEAIRGAAGGSVVLQCGFDGFKFLANQLAELPADLLACGVDFEGFPGILIISEIPTEILKGF